ncbi:MAG: hypothetical protein V3V16_09910 [Melioribacteraceae bacterium]
MKQHKTLVIFLILFYSSVSFGQNSYDNNSAKVKVSVISSSQDSKLIGKKITKYCNNALEEKGMFSGNSNEFDVEYLIDYKILSDSKIIVAVTVMDVIPKELVKLGVDNEIFYKNTKIDSKKLSDRGKEVRKYVNSEYVQQFRMITDNFIDIISEDEIEEWSNKITSQYFAVNK